MTLAPHPCAPLLAFIGLVLVLMTTTCSLPQHVKAEPWLDQGFQKSLIREKYTPHLGKAITSHSRDALGTKRPYSQQIQSFFSENTQISAFHTVFLKDPTEAKWKCSNGKQSDPKVHYFYLIHLTDTHTKKEMASKNRLEFGMKGGKCSSLLFILGLLV